jgi:hypothetical protein
MNKEFNLIKEKILKMWMLNDSTNEK